MATTYYFFESLSHNWNLGEGEFFTSYSSRDWECYTSQIWFSSINPLYIPACVIDRRIVAWLNIFGGSPYMNPFNLYIIHNLLAILNFYEIVMWFDTIGVFYSLSEFLLFQEYYEVYLNFHIQGCNTSFYQRYVSAFQLRPLLAYLDDYPSFKFKSKKMVQHFWEKPNIGLSLPKKLFFDLYGSNFIYKGTSNFTSFNFHFTAPLHVQNFPCYYYFIERPYLYQFQLRVYESPLFHVRPPKMIYYKSFYLKSIIYQFEWEHLLDVNSRKVLYQRVIYDILNKSLIYISYYFSLSSIPHNVLDKSWFYICNKFIVIFFVLVALLLYLYFFKCLLRFIFNIYKIFYKILNYSYLKFNSIEFEIIRNSNSSRIFRLVTVIFIVERLMSRLNRTGYYGNFDKVIISVWFMVHKWFTGAAGLAYSFRIFYLIFYGIFYTTYMLFFYYFYKHFFSKNVVGITILIFCKYYIYLCHILFNVFMTPTIIKNCWVHGINFLNYVIIWYFLNVNFVFMNMFSHKYPSDPFYFFQADTYKTFPLDYSPLFYKFFKSGYFPEYDNIKLKLEFNIFFIIIYKILNVSSILFFYIFNFISHYNFSLGYSLYWFFFKNLKFFLTKFLFFKKNFKFVYFLFFISLLFVFKFFLIFLILCIILYWFILNLKFSSKKLNFKFFNYLFFCIGLFFDSFFSICYWLQKFFINICNFIWQIKKIFIFIFISFLLYKFGYDFSVVLEIIKIVYFDLAIDIISSILIFLKTSYIFDFIIWFDPDSRYFDCIVEKNTTNFFDFTNYLLECEGDYMRYIEQWFGFIDDVRPELGYKKRINYWYAFTQFKTYPFFTIYEVVVLYQTAKYKYKAYVPLHEFFSNNLYIFWFFDANFRPLIPLVILPIISIVSMIKFLPYFIYQHFILMWTYNVPCFFWLIINYLHYRILFFLYFFLLLFYAIIFYIL